MAEKIMWLAVILNISACAYSTWAYLKWKKGIKEIDVMRDIYTNLIFNAKHALFRILGAYDTENDEMYLDLEGGLRLVIAEGKIKGWYMTE